MRRRARPAASALPHSPQNLPAGRVQLPRSSGTRSRQGSAALHAELARRVVRGATGCAVHEPLQRLATA